MARTHSSNIVNAMEDGTFFVIGEVPTGSINGSNVTFTLADAPNPTTSLELTLNGAELTVTEDYTLGSDTLTMVTAPPTTSLMKADYHVSP